MKNKHKLLIIRYFCLLRKYFVPLQQNLNYYIIGIHRNDNSNETYFFSLQLTDYQVFQNLVIPKRSQNRYKIVQ